jgi:hypothetical protein
LAKDKESIIDRLKSPSSITLTASPPFVSVTYESKGKGKGTVEHKKRKRTNHDKEVELGLAGAMLETVAPLRRHQVDSYSKVLPSLVGSNYNGGVPTSEVMWIAPYTEAVEIAAFGDLGNSNWFNESHQISNEDKASRFVKYAVSHLQTGYPELYEKIVELRELDAKHASLFEKVGKGYYVTEEQVPAKPTLLGAFDFEEQTLASISGGHVSILPLPSFERGKGKPSDPDMAKKLDELRISFEALRESRAVVVRDIVKNLMLLRLRVGNDKPIEGHCAICER